MGPGEAAQTIRAHQYPLPFTHLQGGVCLNILLNLCAHLRESLTFVRQEQLGSQLANCSVREGPLQMHDFRTVKPSTETFFEGVKLHARAHPVALLASPHLSSSHHPCRVDTRPSHYSACFRPSVGPGSLALGLPQGPWHGASPCSLVLTPSPTMALPPAAGPPHSPACQV